MKSPRGAIRLESFSTSHGDWMMMIVFKQVNVIFKCYQVV